MGYYSEVAIQFESVEDVKILIRKSKEQDEPGVIDLLKSAEWAREGEEIAAHWGGIKWSTRSSGVRFIMSYLTNELTHGGAYYVRVGEEMGDWEERSFGDFQSSCMICPVQSIELDALTGSFPDDLF